VVSPTLNTNEASLGIATVGIAFHLDPSHIANVNMSLCSRKIIICDVFDSV